MLDDLINATSSASAVATSLAFLQSHYPSSFSSALGIHSADQSILMPGINANHPDPVDRASTTTTTATTIAVATAPGTNTLEPVEEKVVVNGESDVNNQCRRVCLDENSSKDTIIPNGSNAPVCDSQSNSMLAHLNTNECSSLTTAIADDQTPLSSLLLNDRRGSQTTSTVPLLDRTALIHTSTDECKCHLSICERFGCRNMLRIVFC